MARDARDDKKSAEEHVKHLTKQNALAGGKSKADPTLETTEADNLKTLNILKWFVFGMVVFFALILVIGIIVVFGESSARARVDSLVDQDTALIVDLDLKWDAGNQSTTEMNDLNDGKAIDTMIRDKLATYKEWDDFVAMKAAAEKSQESIMALITEIQNSGFDRANVAGDNIVGFTALTNTHIDLPKRPLEAFYPAFGSSFYGVGCHVDKCAFQGGDNQFQAPGSIEECMKKCVAKKVPSATVEYGFTYKADDGVECICKETGGDVASFNGDANAKKYVYYKFN